MYFVFYTVFKIIDILSNSNYVILNFNNSSKVFFILLLGINNFSFNLPISIIYLCFTINCQIKQVFLVVFNSEFLKIKVKLYQLTNTFVN
ncbi:hypothetical protein SAMN04488057_11287 [Cyclobacterium lianum]|uniref:Uncharacterized protein n=1 Tax=Cyclobacterium lianum TaxID=388280 RepID=A0A1M7PZH3_9BACT|nr:hypothetical protein SAMN04488057_11287 [Cyclobacterium lianum]